jgi:inosine/xanthosine triphosphate pyrophosphatase family protein
LKFPIYLYTGISIRDGGVIMDFSGLKLVSSNKDKLQEFRSYGLTGLRIAKGKDLREVDSDPITVVLYKALDAGNGHIIEDSSLFIEGSDIGVDVKFQLSNIHRFIGHRAEFSVYLAVNYNGRIEIYVGSVTGMITRATDIPEGERVFGFDNNFLPLGSSFNLHELAKRGQKSIFSPRRLAVENMLIGRSVGVRTHSSIPPWKGGYQG